MVAAPVHTLSDENQVEIVPAGQITHLAGPRLGLPSMGELETLKTYGELVIASGMAPAHITKWETAVVVMRYGHQLGVDEFTALQNMYVINKKPAMMASLMHALILRDHGANAIEIVESTERICTLRCTRRGAQISTTVEYTIEEAEAAELTKRNSVWKQYPKDMLFARAISRAGRQVFRDTTMGLYTPEEIGGSVIDAHGEIVDIDEVRREETRQAARQERDTEQATAAIADGTKATRAQLNEVANLAQKLGLDRDALRAKLGKEGKDLSAEEAQQTIYTFKLDVADAEVAAAAPATGELPDMPVNADRYTS